MLILRPHSREPGDPLRGHTQVTAGANQRFFHLADEVNCSDAWSERPEVEDGIADKLAGTVKRNVATSVGFDDFNSFSGQEIARGDYILSAGVAPQCNDGRMFQQQQRVANASFFYQVYDRLLKPETSLIVHAAKVKHIDDAELHAFIVRRLKCGGW